MSLSLTRGILPRTGLPALIAALNLPCEIQLPDSTGIISQTGTPVCRVIFNSTQSLETPMTELGVARAFIAGEIEVEGDISVLFNIRQNLEEKVPLLLKLRFVWDMIRTTTTMNRDSINKHYSRGDDFYLAFIDKRYRFYSHGLFNKQGETIEEASEHKLESMFRSLDLKPGMRLLDIGGGWGGVTQYCGARGIHVTSLTIAEDSAQFIQRVLSDSNLKGEVFLQDFLQHVPEEPYDHAVIYGVIEHLPDYRRFAAKVWDVLKPGGRLYLDGAAAVQKFAVSAFCREYIWPGTHTFMTIQDVIREFLYHGFEVVEVARETSDYGNTMLEWAKRLDLARDEIIAGWGEETYRIFRLYLWGGQHAFKIGTLQAYHLVVERTPSHGPRPSSLRRFLQFITDN